jgi:hypothetical protein
MPRESRVTDAHQLEAGLVFPCCNASRGNYQRGRKKVAADRTGAAFWGCREVDDKGIVNRTWMDGGFNLS